ncbi:hypothetical protein AB0M23_21505 [Streptomyces sp. NPDC052077]|uniref:hypothetical protein n=1 Tax=Streptomyces sp. NPDC052077 TaxID=3154757 RepID=UPI0034458662
MRAPRVLLLEAAGPESGAIARTAAASGYQVHAATDPATHSTYDDGLRRLLSGCLLADLSRPDRALEDIVGYARRIGADAVLTANEYLTPLLTQACAELDLPGNDPARAITARDKAAMSEAFAVPPASPGSVQSWPAFASQSGQWRRIQNRRATFSCSGTFRPVGRAGAGGPAFHAHSPGRCRSRPFRRCVLCPSLNSPSQLAHFFAVFPVSWGWRARSYEPRDSFGARAGLVSCVPSRRTMVTSEAGGRS